MYIFESDKVVQGKEMKEQEIKLLREEIMRDYNEIMQYSCVLYSVIAAVMAFALEYSDNYLLCMLPYLVMFPIHFMCEARRESICCIGAYLYVFADINYQWERRIQRLDIKTWKHGKGKKRFLKKYRMHFQYYIIAICCSMAALQKVCLANYSREGKMIIIGAICIWTLLSMVVIKKTIVLIPNRRTEYIKKWKQIKDEESIKTIATREKIIKGKRTRV